MARPRCVWWRTVVVLIIIEEARAAPQTWLVRQPIPPRRIHGKRRVLPQVMWLDSLVAMYLIVLFPPMAWHQRDRHPPRIEDPTVGEVNVANPHRHVVAMQRPGHHEFATLRKGLSRVRMAILPMGTGTRGYRIRMGRVWAHFCTHG
jgi:hypothetical protein